MRETLELAGERVARIAAAGQHVAAGVGEAEREAAAVLGIGLALDQAGADQRIDRTADRRRAAAECGGDFVQGRGLMPADGGQQFASGGVGALGRAVGQPVARGAGETDRQRGGRVRAEIRLLHNNSLNPSKVAIVKKNVDESAVSKRPALPRSVWVLGFVSLLTDLSSESYHALLPAFVTVTLALPGVALGTRTRNALFSILN